MRVGQQSHSQRAGLGRVPRGGTRPSASLRPPPIARPTRVPRWQVLSQVSDPTTLAQLDHILDDVQQTVEAEHSVLLPARLCVAALRADARAMLLRALMLNRAAPMEVFKSTLLEGLAGTAQQPQHADDGVLRVEAALCDGVRRAAQQRLLQVMAHRVACHRAVNSSDDAVGPSSEIVVPRYTISLLASIFVPSGRLTLSPQFVF